MCSSVSPCCSQPKSVCLLPAVDRRCRALYDPPNWPVWSVRLPPARLAGSPVPPAADLQDALTKCIRGYTPGVFLQPRQIICLPPWYDACANVVTAGEAAAHAALPHTILCPYGDTRD